VGNLHLEKYVGFVDEMSMWSLIINNSNNLNNNNNLEKLEN
jgi:hypothetical protein